MESHFFHGLGANLWRGTSPCQIHTPSPTYKTPHAVQEPQPIKRAACKDRSQYECFKYPLTKLSNNTNASVIPKWSSTLAIFETISETTQEILEN